MPPQRPSASPAARPRAGRACRCRCRCHCWQPAVRVQEMHACPWSCACTRCEGRLTAVAAVSATSCIRAAEARTAGRVQPLEHSVRTSPALQLSCAGALRAAGCAEMPRGPTTRPLHAACCHPGRVGRRCCRAFLGGSLGTGGTRTRPWGRGEGSSRGQQQRLCVRYQVTRLICS